MTNREQTATDLALTLMEKHGLIAEGWTFKLNGRPYKRLGCCWQHRKVIELSSKWVNTPEYPDEELKDTILHEIAHALTPGWGHSLVWQHTACNIGCKPKRFYEGPVKPKGRYEGYGVETGTLYTTRHRLTRTMKIENGTSHTETGENIIWYDTKLNRNVPTTECKGRIAR